MYNPSDVGKKGTIFGLPYKEQEADLILLPVHLDVTVSYGDGTSLAPDLILEESSQLDLAIPNILDPWKLKMALADRIVDREENYKIRTDAKKVIHHLEQGSDLDASSEQEKVNAFCERVHDSIEQKADELLGRGKLVGIVGGDHSSPIGLIRSLARTHEFGILQVDAHMDLREAYEGFTYSHASIMYNALKLEGVQSLTQVGIRDYAKVEEDLISDSQKSIHVFFDEEMSRSRFQGDSWEHQTKAILATLPENVYISFDIDGLDPSLCPKTGTPVPGGLAFQEALYLMEQLVQSGRKIIGFDVCEVGNGTWDANVGARIIYRLATSIGVSQGLLHFK